MEDSFVCFASPLYDNRNAKTNAQLTQEQQKDYQVAKYGADGKGKVERSTPDAEAKEPYRKVNK